MKYESTKIIELGSCAFRQWRADSHCKYLHGYRLLAKFWFECSGLDDKNWVVDFGGLDELKQLLQKQFDHTTCIAADDPLIESFKALHNLGAVDLRIMDGGVGIERTAEYCLKIANKYIQEKTTGRCWVSRVEVWEHEKNSAIAIYSHDRVSSHLSTTLQSTHCCQQDNVPVEPVAAATTNNQPQQTTNTPRGAAVGNKVTTGWSNPFKGTSWGV